MSSLVGGPAPAWRPRSSGRAGGRTVVPLGRPRAQSSRSGLPVGRVGSRLLLPLRGEASPQPVKSPLVRCGHVVKDLLIRPVGQHHSDRVVVSATWAYSPSPKRLPARAGCIARMGWQVGCCASAGYRATRVTASRTCGERTAPGPGA